MEENITLSEVKTNRRLEYDLLLLIKQRSSNFDSDAEVLKRIGQYSSHALHLLMVASSNGTPSGYIWIQNYGPNLRDGKCLARLHDIFVSSESRGKKMQKYFLTLERVGARKIKYRICNGKQIKMRPNFIKNLDSRVTQSPTWKNIHFTRLNSNASKTDSNHILTLIAQNHRFLTLR